MLRRPGRPVGETKLGELGIACEACHGPAAEHVEQNRNPANRYKLHLAGGEDPTIVQPGDLDHVRSTQICGQCHAVHRKLPGAWSPDSGATFRPGENLEDYQDVVTLQRIRSRPDSGTLLHNSRSTQDGIARFGFDLTAYFWPDGTARGAS